MFLLGSTVIKAIVVVYHGSFRNLNPRRQEKKSNKLLSFSLVMYSNYSASYFILFL